jgi:hypothetical protein
MGNCLYYLYINGKVEVYSYNELADVYRSLKTSKSKDVPLNIKGILFSKDS